MASEPNWLNFKAVRDLLPHPTLQKKKKRKKEANLQFNNNRNNG